MPDGILWNRELESLEARRNNVSRSFFRTFANQTPVSMILSHFHEIPLFFARLRLTSTFPRPVYA